MKQTTDVLSKIQQTIKAPKGQYNKFGKFRYRSCEDILMAAKPVLSDHEATLLLDDLIEMIGDRFYIKATAKLYHNGELIAEVSSYAREPETKKGMDESQITGSASSYARKYALAGLFLLDDNKEVDSGASDVMAEVALEIEKCDNLKELTAHYEAHRDFASEHPGILDFYASRKKQLNDRACKE